MGFVDTPHQKIKIHSKLWIRTVIILYFIIFTTHEKNQQSQNLDPWIEIISQL